MAGVDVLLELSCDHDRGVLSWWKSSGGKGPGVAYSTVVAKDRVAATREPASVSPGATAGPTAPASAPIHP